MKRLLLLFIILCCIVGCSRRDHLSEQMDQMDNIVNTKPDSALSILKGIEKNSAKNMTKADFMKLQLLIGKAQNKANVKFTSDSMMKEVVAYYDDKGNANEQMLSNYLLGCVYRDLNEAPLALQYYHIAESKADTTSASCDYGTLCRVYSQMAALFHIQHLYNEEFKANTKAIRDAWKDKDTLTALICYQNMQNYFYAINDTDSVEKYSRQAYQMYNKYGYHAMALSALASSMVINVERKNNRQAYHDILLYEKQSGFFDKNGNITPGREFFYYIKGRYFVNNNQLDSAKYYFYKTLASQDETDISSAYKGLVSVYELEGRSDSLAKYALLYADINDYIHENESTEDLQRIQSLYNYDRSRQLAEEKTIEASHSRLLNIILAFLIIIIAIIGYVLFVRIRNKRLEQIKRISNHYATDLLLFQKMKSEMENLKYQDKENKGFIKEKQEEIEKLKKDLSEYQTDKSSPDNWAVGDNAMNAPIVSQLHRLAAKGQSADFDEWNELHSMMDKLMPQFVHELYEKGPSIGLKATNICLLTKLRFIPSEISILTISSPQSVTNMRVKLLKRLFGVEGGAKDFDKKIMNM